MRFFSYYLLLSVSFVQTSDFGCWDVSTCRDSNGANQRLLVVNPLDSYADRSASKHYLVAKITSQMNTNRRSSRNNLIAVILSQRMRTDLLFNSSLGSKPNKCQQTLLSKPQYSRFCLRACRRLMVRWLTGIKSFRQFLSTWEYQTNRIFLYQIYAYKFS